MSLSLLFIIFGILFSIVGLFHVVFANWIDKNITGLARVILLGPYNWGLDKNGIRLLGIKNVFGGIIMLFFSYGLYVGHR